MRCCNCNHTANKTLVHQGTTYNLCALCHERAALTLAAIARYTAVARGILSLPRG